MSPLCLAPLLSLAQQAPQVTPRDLRPEPSARPPAALPQPASAEVPENAESLFVRVGDFSVQDGFPEFSAKTEALLSPVRNERVSVASLYRLAESIERVYRSAGYALVRVVIPPQKLADGDTLRLIVLDGFVERVDVSAVDTRSRDHVAKMMQSLVGMRQMRGRGPGARAHPSGASAWSGIAQRDGGGGWHRARLYWCLRDGPPLPVEPFP